MSDTLPPGAHEGLETEEEISPVWEEFRSGGPATCPADGLSLALSVDGAAGIYRFVCTACGFSSPWFEAAGPEVLVHGRSTPDIGSDG